MFVDGEELYSNDIASGPTELNRNEEHVTYTGSTVCQVSNGYAIKGVRVYTNPGTTFIDDATVVVENGTVTCINTTCTIPPGFDEYELQGGVLAPGLIDAGTRLGMIHLFTLCLDNHFAPGQEVIPAESAGHDGTAFGVDNRLVHAIDGILLDHRVC